jgi:carboxyl-terminal processing protease
VKSVRDAALLDRERGIGYARISTFQRDTARDLRRAVLHLLDQGCRGLVLDLRNNPGGTLETAVAAADLFIHEGILVTTSGRGPDATQAYRASGEGTLPAFPLAVLINEGCASATEILAGSLRAHGRAILVGSRTYGKRSVQTVALLSDGWALKLTTARFAFPGEKKGTGGGDLAPDIEVTTEGKEDSALQVALGELGKRLK